MTSPHSLSLEPSPELARALRDANQTFSHRYPGDSGSRQPVHTVYGGGHLFRADTARKLGAIALRALDEFAPDPWTFASAVGLPGAESIPASARDRAALHNRMQRDDDAVQREAPGAWLALMVDRRVREKLERAPVEDFRIDFEDGYGARPDAEEDAHVSAAAAEVVRGARAGTLPPFIGIRVKPLNEEWRRRSVRTLDLFVTALVRENGSELPSGFVVTLPKITIVEQVTYFVRLLEGLERKLGLAVGTLRFEIMIETPQAIIDATGRCLVPMLLHAGAGRISAAHFGTYDYTAGCNITAAHQRMRHDACQFALRALQVACAGTGVWISDGSTTVMPVPIHHPPVSGAALTTAQVAENRATVHRAWRLHYDDVRQSLMNGYYQGWDLHPAQLPTRYAALFAFFLEGLDAAATRLRTFVRRAAQATLVGDVFDDAATGQGLLNYFLRAINSGAISSEEAIARTGMSRDDFRNRSFVRIIGNTERGTGNRE